MEINGTCLSEASRTYNKEYYGVSFNISPHKKIGGVCFKKMDDETQKNLLIDVFSNAQLDIIGHVTSDYVFEYTQAGHNHLHALVYATEGEMKVIQNNINKQFGYAKDPIHRVLHYSKTLVHKSFWNKYMSKEDHNKDHLKDTDYVPNYNMFLTE